MQLFTEKMELHTDRINSAISKKEVLNKHIVRTILLLIILPDGSHLVNHEFGRRGKSFHSSNKRLINIIPGHGCIREIMQSLIYYIPGGYLLTVSCSYF